MKNFKTDCVSCRSENLAKLGSYIDKRKSISVSTFKKQIGTENFLILEQKLGYRDSNGKLFIKTLTLATDWSVSFGKGKFGDANAVDCTHSAIEYIYA